MKVLLVFSTLLALSLANYATMRFCSMRKCRNELRTCWRDRSCSENQACWRSCDVLKQSKCQADCGLFSDPIQHELIQCQADQDCFPTDSSSSFGHCLATDNEAIQEPILTKVANADWWVIKSTTEHDCEADIAAYGDYNKEPCSKLTFGSKRRDSMDGQTSFCLGNNGVCETSAIVHDFVATTDAPGVVKITALPDTGVIGPQEQKLKFLSFPHPDYALAASCVVGPTFQVNGLFVLSKHKDGLSNMPSGVSTAFSQAASRVGINFSRMCVSNLSTCTN